MKQWLEQTEQEEREQTSEKDCFSKAATVLSSEKERAVPLSFKKLHYIDSAVRETLRLTLVFLYVSIWNHLAHGPTPATGYVDCRVHLGCP